MAKSTRKGARDLSVALTVYALEPTPYNLLLRKRIGALT